MKRINQVTNYGKPKTISIAGKLFSPNEAVLQMWNTHYKIPKWLDYYSIKDQGDADEAVRLVRSGYEWFRIITRDEQYVRTKNQEAKWIKRLYRYDRNANPLTLEEKQDLKHLANIQHAISQRYAEDPVRSSFYHGRSVAMGKVARMYNPTGKKIRLAQSTRCPRCNSGRVYVETGWFDSPAGRQYMNYYLCSKCGHTWAGSLNPSKSIAQQKLFGIALGIKEGKIPKRYSPEAAKLAARMSKRKLKEFAETEHGRLPGHVNPTKLSDVARRFKSSNEFLRTQARDYTVNFPNHDTELEAVDKFIRSEIGKDPILQAMNKERMKDVPIGVLSSGNQEILGKQTERWTKLYHQYFNDLRKSSKNPMTKAHPLAIEARQRYQEDLKAGHKDAAEYWRGQAGAYFTGNPHYLGPAIGNMYYCLRCQRYHNKKSKIGRAHKIHSWPNERGLLGHNPSDTPLVQSSTIPGFDDISIDKIQEIYKKTGVWV